MGTDARERVGILGREDEAALQALAERVGWQFTRDQTSLFLNGLGRVRGVWCDGVLIASAGLYLYDGRIASLGNVMVNPQFRRQGLATRLVIECLAEAKAAGAPVLLVATPMGEPLYRKLGFQTIGYVHRLEFDPADTPAAGSSLSNDVRPLQPGDLEEIVRLDERAFGACRRTVYETLSALRTPGWGYRDTDGALLGFTFAIRKPSALCLGPVVARDVSIALALVRRVSSDWTGPVRVDVPHEQTAFRCRLTAGGFRERMTSPVMSIGTDRLPGERPTLFALLDPAMG
ncbi:MAG: GNAT family N-acetyltransferase [Alicyclobacillus macrosporangiidus]|uniref:GNAT family N-acetyltransferase n=1 Tax=Alicyclobacillus macrosporangiidus TaxID=392015 RepID=UPI0026ECF261|nr:GNAT family N-acetyltransferase [Alicyclobacillus macrosporangiidus]MCL6599730.1 GNAT family N-acetyltransferase [Alicyclobacillus macrosporangiidus]